MIRWILIGIVRDKTRSLFPFMVVTAGVALVIYLIGFMDGIFAGMIDMTANLDTGHLRLVNQSFYEEEHLVPLDRALAGQKEVGNWLRKHSDERIKWSPRIRWGAIMDVPDEKGETRSQTPVTGMAINLLNADSMERQRMDLEKAVLVGKVPDQHGEMLVGYRLAQSLELKPGDTVTLLGQSYDGGLSTDNYTVAGLIRFGIAAMDKKMTLIDLSDAQQSFYMEDMVTDWLGFVPASVGYKEYDRLRDEIAAQLPELKKHPPAAWATDDDPIVLSILDQRNFRELARKFELVRTIIVGIFMFLMVLVLWNAGILNSIHRYGEMGLMLALGETHSRLILMLAGEALLVGILGSAAGSLIGGASVYYLQEVGVSTGGVFEQSGLMMSDVARGRLSLAAFFYGIIPGILASVLGNFIANLAIYNRSEANLFRELETG